MLDFRLEYRPGQGLIWNLDNNTGTGPAIDNTLAWGSGFVPALTGTNQIAQAAINGKAPPTSFNALQLTLRAQNDPSQLQFSNLTFTAAGVGTSGTLSAAETVATPPLAIGDDQYEQWILADAGSDLGLFAWTLSGKVSGNRDDGAAFGEGTRFIVDLKNVTPVPEPASIASLLGGLLLLGAIARRRVR